MILRPFLYAAGSCAEALVSDAPPPPAHRAEIVAANKLGDVLTAA